MYSVIAFMAWSMLGLCSLILLAELVDMITSARRRRLADGPAEAGSFGSFNLEPHESNLSRRHDHKLRTTNAGWGGVNRFD